MNDKAHLQIHKGFDLRNMFRDCHLKGVELHPQAQLTPWPSNAARLAERLNQLKGEIASAKVYARQHQIREAFKRTGLRDAEPVR